MYPQSVREGWGAVSARITIATARCILLNKCNHSKTLGSFSVEVNVVCSKVGYNFKKQAHCGTISPSWRSWHQVHPGLWKNGWCWWQMPNKCSILWLHAWRFSTCAAIRARHLAVIPFPLSWHIDIMHSLNNWSTEETMLQYIQCTSHY